MKKVILTPSLIIVLVMLIGADIRRTAREIKPQKKFCNGYTIVEFGKAIDCNGDTINLVKVNGGQQQVKSRQEPV